MTLVGFQQTGAQKIHVQTRCRHPWLRSRGSSSGKSRRTKSSLALLDSGQFLVNYLHYLRPVERSRSGSLSMGRYARS
jgi:hypothetical protein